MSRKNKPDSKGIVFSTDPNFHFYNEEREDRKTLLPKDQKLILRLDTKHRSGKAVTLVEGFTGANEDLEALGRKLKNFCGTGGSVKDRQIIIQGDQRDKVTQWLTHNEYNFSKK